MQRGNIPLPIAELINELAFGLRWAHLKQLVEGWIGRLHAEVRGEDEEFPDCLDNLFSRVLGFAEGLLPVLLRGERRFQLGDPLAQGSHVLGQRLGGAQHLPSMGSSLARTRHVLDQHPRHGYRLGS